MDDSPASTGSGEAHMIMHIPDTLEVLMIS